jgi:Protein of unknown function (DUF2690)
MHRKRIRVAVVAGFGALVMSAAVPAYAADSPNPAPSSSTSVLQRLAAEGEALQAAELAGPAGGEIQGPHRVVDNPDGTQDLIADEPVSIAAASSDACGSACDGENPATYLVKLPGGQSNWYHCSADAFTKYTKRSSDSKYYAELRYSPRCRTAWTRGCCYTTYAGFSYNSSGSQRETVKAGCGSCPDPLYTAMLNDAGYTYKACYNRVVAGDPADWQCTSKY